MKHATSKFQREDEDSVIGIREGLAQLEAGEYLELADEAALKGFFVDVVSRGKARAEALKGKDAKM